LIVVNELASQPAIYIKSFEKRPGCLTGIWLFVRLNGNKIIQKIKFVRRLISKPGICCNYGSKNHGCSGESKKVLARTIEICQYLFRWLALAFEYGITSPRGAFAPAAWRNPWLRIVERVFPAYFPCFLLLNSFASAVESDSWHGVSMKRVGWLRKLCLGSCVNVKERDNLNGSAISTSSVGTEVLRSRATIAEATGASATAALALGVLAIGGLAIGFLVIGRLIIRELQVKRVHLRHLRIDQLEVEDLRVKKLTILEKERTTDGTGHPLPEQS
jgi:hypothetical protein